MKQTETILKHIEEFGSITPLDAMQEYGIMRLAARIADIKKKGINIKSEIVRSQNRFGDTVRYSRYSLGGNDDDERAGTE